MKRRPVIEWPARVVVRPGFWTGFTFAWFSYLALFAAASRWGAEPVSRAVAPIAGFVFLWVFLRLVVRFFFEGRLVRIVVLEDARKDQP